MALVEHQNALQMMQSSNRKLSYRMQMTSSSNGLFLSAIKCIFVESKEFEEVRKILARRTCPPVCGTMKLHAAFAFKDVLWTRATSCYFKECFTGSELQPSCDGWSSDKINKSTAATSSKGKKTKSCKGRKANLVKAPSPRTKMS